MLDYISEKGREPLSPRPPEKVCVPSLMRRNHYGSENHSWLKDRRKTEIQASTQPSGYHSRSPRLKTWVRSPSLVPDSSFLLTQTREAAGRGLRPWALATPWWRAGLSSGSLLGPRSLQKSGE